MRAQVQDTEIPVGKAAKKDSLAGSLDNFSADQETHDDEAPVQVVRFVTGPGVGLTSIS